MKRGRRPHPDILTPREWEVLELIRDGLSNEEIAARLGVSIDGAKYHVSEILTKLGVPDRLAAARWRPGRERAVLPIPIPGIRLGWSHVIGGAAFAVVVASTVGVFVWLLGAVDSGRGETHVVGIATTATPAGPQGSIMLFDAGTGSARRISADHSLNYAQWLVPGETFIALDINARAWKVYNLDGDELRTLVTLPPEDIPYVTAHVYPSPQGDVAILTRYTPPDRLPSVLIGTVLLDLDSLAETPLAGPPGGNAYHMFSPDGRRLAFTNENAGQGFLMVGNVNGGDATILRSATLPDDWSIPIQWSPDGSQLLIESNPPGSSNLSYEVIDLSGSSVWQLDVPAGRSFTNAQWAGPGRVLVDQQDEPIGGAAPPISRRLIRIADGGELPFLTWQFNANLSISPDGAHAILREDIPLAEEYQNDYTGHAPGGARCALIDIEQGSYTDSVLSARQDVNAGFCATFDWSPDGKFALVSMGGI